MSLTNEEREHRLKERRFKKWEKEHKIISGIDHKICSECHTWKPSNTERFYKNKSNKIDGLFPYCIDCTKEKSKVNIAENRDRRNAYMKEWMKQPRVKNQVKLRGRKRRKRGELLRWQRENRDKIIEYGVRRETRIHDIPDSEWRNCKSYFNNSCAYCGLHVNEHWVTYARKPKKTDLHREHVKHEGSNRLDNCLPSCKACNSEKHQASLYEWYTKDNPKFSEERLELIEKWLDDDFRLYIEN